MPWSTHALGKQAIFLVWAWMLWGSYALGTRTVLWFGHGCSGQRMLLEHERYYDLGLGALVKLCSWNTNGLMVWAWMLWSMYALGTRTIFWLGPGCSGRRSSLNTNRIMVWAWTLWSTYALEMVCSRTWMLLWFGHECCGHSMLSNNL